VFYFRLRVSFRISILVRLRVRFCFRLRISVMVSILVRLRVTVRVIV